MMDVFCVGFLAHVECVFARDATPPTTDVEAGNDVDDEEEHEEMPEDLSHLDPQTQQYYVKMRAAWLMIVGTTLVLVFSGEDCWLRFARVIRPRCWLSVNLLPQGSCLGPFLPLVIDMRPSFSFCRIQQTCFFISVSPILQTLWWA